VSTREEAQPSRSLQPQQSPRLRRSFQLQSISRTLAIVGGVLVLVSGGIIGWSSWQDKADWSTSHKANTYSPAQAGLSPKVQDLRPTYQMQLIGLLAEEYWRTRDIIRVREMLAGAGWYSSPRDSSAQGQRALAEIMNKMESKLAESCSYASSPQDAQALQHLITLREALEMPEVVVPLNSILRQGAVLWSSGLASILMLAAAIVAFAPIPWQTAIEEKPPLAVGLDFQSAGESVFTEIEQILAENKYIPLEEGNILTAGEKVLTEADYTLTEGTDILTKEGHTLTLAEVPEEIVAKLVERGPSLLEQQFADVEKELLEEEAAELAASEEGEGEPLEKEEKEEDGALVQLVGSEEPEKIGLGDSLSDLFEIEEEEQIDLDNLTEGLADIDTAALLEEATDLAEALRAKKPRRALRK